MLALITAVGAYVRKVRIYTRNVRAFVNIFIRFIHSHMGSRGNNKAAERILRRHHRCSSNKPAAPAVTAAANAITVTVLSARAVNNNRSGSTVHLNLDQDPDLDLDLDLDNDLDQDLNPNRDLDQDLDPNLDMGLVSIRITIGLYLDLDPDLDLDLPPTSREAQPPESIRNRGFGSGSGYTFYRRLCLPIIDAGGYWLLLLI